MRKATYKFEYDRSTDAAYLTLSKRRIAASEEVQPGLVVDFDQNNNVVGVEILRFTRRFQKASKASKATRASAA